MFKTFKKCWSIVDVCVDLVVDLAKAIQREIKESDTPPPKFDSQTGEPIPEKK